MLEITYQIIFLGSPLFLVAVAQGLCIRYVWLQTFKKPLDFGFSFKGRRIFGDHKTWRGLLINVLFCLVGARIQARLQTDSFVPPWLFLLNYREYGYLAGFLLGLGMTVGELPNSFLKRQMDTAPGRKKKGAWGIFFFLMDQVDLTIGIWLCLFLLIRPSLFLVLWSLVITLVLHILISTFGYILGMRNTIV